MPTKGKPMTIYGSGVSTVLGPLFAILAIASVFGVAHIAAKQAETPSCAQPERG